MSEQERKSNSALSLAGKVVGICLLGGFIWAAANFRIVPPAVSGTNACINNLRQIETAANEFALENHLTNGDRINFPSDLTPYIRLDKDGKIPGCPQGGIYHISKVGEPPTCSLGTTVTPAHVLP